MAYYIGLDIGTSSVKAALLRDGKTVTYRALYDENLGNTPEGWWKAVCDAIGQVSRDCGDDCGGIGITAQVGTYLLADISKPVQEWPVYTWGGSGGTEQRARLYRELGTDFFLKTTGMPLPMVPSYPSARLTWFKEERTDEWNACNRIYAPKDFLYERMTGQFASDTLSWNGMSNPKTGRVEDTYFHTLGFDASRFAPLYSSLSAPGKLTEKTAKILGLRPGTPVYQGCNDSHAAFLGMGVTSVGQAFDLTGTSEHVGMITPDAVGEGEIICSPFFEGFATFGVTQSSGQSIDWGYRCFGLPQNADSEKDLRQVLDGVLDGTRKPPVFLPYVNGERSPIWDGDARGVFVGISDKATLADMVYSVLEGVVFSVYHIWSGLPQNLTEKAESIYMGGGASENTLLNDMKASLLGTALSIPAEKNTGALGAGLIAAVGSGAYANLSEAVQDYVTITRRVLPAFDPNALRRRFALYKTLTGMNRTFRIPEQL